MRKTVVGILALITAFGAHANLLSEGSFEVGETDASLYEFAGNAGNIPLDITLTNKWVSREGGSGKGEFMTVDIGPGNADGYTAVTGQTDTKSLLFRAGSMRGAAQIVAANVMIGDTINFSFDCVLVGDATNHNGEVEMIGFNDFTGLTCDLGGSATFTGGSYDLLVNTSLDKGVYGGTTYVNFSNSVVATANYDYMAIILGGDAGTGLTLVDYAAFDNVVLDVVPAPVLDDPTLLLSPSDSLAIGLTAPATLSTGTVDVAFLYSSSSNSIEITEVNIIDQQHSGAFSAVGFSSPLAIASPASSETLNIQFDYTGTGLADGETSTGVVEIVWNEVAGGTFTNLLPVVATYTSDPANLIVTPSTLLMTFTGASGTALDNYSVRYNPSDLTGTNINISAVGFIDTGVSSSAFSVTNTVPFTLPSNATVASNAVPLGILYDNAIGGLAAGDSTTGTVQIVWNEVGLGQNYTNTVLLQVSRLFSAAPGQTMVSNNFDGNDGNDIGSLIQLVSNGAEDTDMSDASTGVISFSDVDSGTPSVGLTSTVGVDFSEVSGFTIEWTVDGLHSTNVNPHTHGWFFGVQNTTAANSAQATSGSFLWNNTPYAIGIRVSQPEALELVENPGGGYTSTGILPLVDIGSFTNSTITVSLTVYSNNTWSATTTGFDVNVTETNGTLGTVLYEDVASSVFASSFYMSSGNIQDTVKYSSVVLKAVADSTPTTPYLSVSSSGGGFLSIGGSNLNAAAVYTLQATDNLVFTNWYDIATTTGVSEVDWAGIIDPTNDASFFRIISE